MILGTLYFSNFLVLILEPIKDICLSLTDPIYPCFSRSLRCAIGKAENGFFYITESTKLLLG